MIEHEYRPEFDLGAAPAAVSQVLTSLLSACGGNRLPGRQHVNPADYCRLLPNINLLDVERLDDELLLRYRLIGSNQIRYFAGGRNETGRYLNDYWKADPGNLRRILTAYEDAIALRKPVMCDFIGMRDRFGFLQFSRTLFPLAADGANVNCILSLYVYQHVERQTRALPVDAMPPVTNLQPVV